MRKGLEELRDVRRRAFLVRHETELRAGGVRVVGEAAPAPGR